jgi:hypothetical protein
MQGVLGRDVAPFFDGTLRFQGAFISVSSMGLRGLDRYPFSEKPLNFFCLKSLFFEQNVRQALNRLAVELINPAGVNHWLSRAKPTATGVKKTTTMASRVQGERRGSGMGTPYGARRQGLGFHLHVDAGLLQRLKDSDQPLDGPKEPFQLLIAFLGQPAPKGFTFGNGVYHLLDRTQSVAK